MGFLQEKKIGLSLGKSLGSCTGCCSCRENCSSMDSPQAAGKYLLQHHETSPPPLLTTKSQDKKTYGSGKASPSCSNVQLKNNPSFHWELLIIQQFKVKPVRVAKIQTEKPSCSFLLVYHSWCTCIYFHKHSNDFRYCFVLNMSRRFALQNDCYWLVSSAFFHNMENKGFIIKTQTRWNTIMKNYLSLILQIALVCLHIEAPSQNITTNLGILWFFERKIFRFCSNSFVWFYFFPKSVCNLTSLLHTKIL